MSQVRTIIIVVVLGVVSLLGIAILGAVGDTISNTEESAGDDEIEWPETGEVHQLDSSIEEAPDHLEISATRGNAIGLDGETFVEGGDVGNWSDGSWSVCLSGRLAGDANQQATYTAFAYNSAETLLVYDDENWSGYHYDGNDSAAVSIASDAAEGYSPVCLTWDDATSELFIDDGESSGSAALTSEGPDRRVSNDWHGSIDEVRLINGTSTGAYLDDPVHPAPYADHSARYMFDEGDGDQTHVYYANASATVVGSASWTDGVQGEPLVEGDDYGVGYDPLRVAALENGTLEDAPVIYVEWETALGGSVASVLDGTAGAIELIPIIMLVLLASTVVVAVRRMQN